MANSPFFDRLNYADTIPGSGSIDPLSNRVIEDLRALPPLKRFRLRDSEYNRPELISWLAYGTVDLYWLVLEYNGVTAREMEPGKEMTLPDAVRVEEVLRAHGMNDRRRPGDAQGVGSYAQRRSRIITV